MVKSGQETELSLERAARKQRKASGVDFQGLMVVKPAQDPELSVESQIRKQRNLRGVTLRGLAKALNISPSQLSKVEIGKAKLTVELALKIADILQVPATVFLSKAKPHFTGRRTISRKHTGSVQTTPGMKLEALCSDFKGNNNIYWNAIITATTLDEIGGWRQHPGQEFIYVISGELQLLSTFYEPVTLAPGDSILFDADQPHAYVAVKGPVSALMINGLN